MKWLAMFSLPVVSMEYYSDIFGSNTEYILKKKIQNSISCFIQNKLEKFQYAMFLIKEKYLYMNKY